MMKQESFRTSILATALFYLIAGVPPLCATIFVSVIPYASNWQTTYNAFAIQESFEQLTLAPGLSITLNGNAFTTSQTYGGLPQLYDPAQPSPFAGPQLNNPWDGTKMVTNYGYDASRPAGFNWNNAWAPTLSSAAQRITFNFAGGASQIGIGLSNFQSENPASPDTSWTNHRLYVNGIPLSQDIEALAGASWTPGGDFRNGYLVITTTDATVINSVGFQNLNMPGGVSEGLNFDALGFTPVPEPSIAGPLTVAGSLLVMGARRPSSGCKRHGNCMVVGLLPALLASVIWLFQTPVAGFAN